MGKRNKTTGALSEGVIKKKKSLEIEEISDINNETCILRKEKKSKSVKKHKSSTPIDTNVADDTDTNTLRKKKENTNKVSSISLQENSLVNEKTCSVNDNRNIIKKSKKIIFVDDTPQEIPVEDVKSNQSAKKSSKKRDSGKNQSQEDDEVKDEDIDKFCDELTEEDNVQFDNWIKLIEAKLHAPKNKSK